MKDKWLNDIHDRMADFEIEEPQGLWDDICAAEDVKTPVTILHKVTKKKWMWSAAAVACLLIGWSLYPTKEQTDDGRVSLATGKVGKAAIAENQFIPDVKVASAKANDPATRHCISTKKTNTEQENNTTVSFTSLDANPTGAIVQTPDSDNCLAREETDTTTILNVATKKDSWSQITYQNLAQVSKKGTPSPSHKRNQQEHCVAIALSSSGGMGNSYRQKYHGDYVGACTSVDDAEWKDSPLLGIMYLNRGAETERKVSHHAPFRTELSVAYKLNERWSVESGISYALATSDIREGSTANYIEDKQKLHYIGVPLGVSYRAASWKGLDVYLSSNVLPELCVSGKTTRNYFMGNKTQQEEVAPITSHPLQMSFGANVGVQYNLNSMLSIYAEPGCRYYFDDHSSIDNVFKERKLDFNLNMGVRFTIGK